MTSIYKHYLKTACSLAAVAVLAACTFTSCSSDSDGGASSGNTVEWDLTKTITPDKAGAAVLEVTGQPGTSWTAEIVSGGDWVSFNRTAPATATGGQATKNGVVGMSLAERTQYVYYWPNGTRNERYATIRFTFQGAEPVEMQMEQFSTNSGIDVYEARWNEAWPEIPAEGNSKLSAGNFTYVTHFGPVYNENTGKEFTGRNYTLCFDKTKRGSWWVAYPMHKAYLGSLSRPKPDPWAFDPKIASDWQANLGAGGYTNGTTWNRGHQIANADRTANRTMQYQTFYCSNSTPQQAQLNQGPWAALEDRVRDWKCSDTLYVVTGAYWKPGSTASTTDRNGQICPIPDNYFKVLVRTVNGNVRKPGDKLGDYSPEQLKSIGFWVANASGQGSASSWVKSVKEIEELTGFEFFPSVPDEVKTQKNPSGWGL